MWLLVIIALTANAPYKVRGSISVPYTTEQQCKDEMNKIIPHLNFSDTRITASCTFRGYLTP